MQHSDRRSSQTPSRAAPSALAFTLDDVRRLVSEDARFAHVRLVSGERELAAGALELSSGDKAAVLLWPAMWRDADHLAPFLSRARASACALLFFGTEEQLADSILEELGTIHAVPMPLPVSASRIAITVRHALAALELAGDRSVLAVSLERARYENEMLISIGRALSQQRDLRSLLDIILRRAREVSGADAGSIYVVEGEDDEDDRKLHFKVAQNDSVEAIETETTGFTMPVSDSSIAGLCVLTGDEINITDLYALDPPGTGNNPWGFVHDRSFDERHGYQTRSMLTVPMISARQQVIGVIQLINKRAMGVGSLCARDSFQRDVVAFDDVSVDYTKSLASQAGIALENAMLHDEVTTLFEGFVRASVTAIEARDPTTSGHSERVARLTVGLAKVVDRESAGRYAELRFTADELTQLEYAALLHDFGKVGVREHVLVKADKLYPQQRELIVQRFAFIKKTLQNQVLQRKVDTLLQASREDILENASPDSALGRALASLDGDLDVRLSEIDEFVRFVIEANRPSVMEAGSFERLADIATNTYLDDTGIERPYLAPIEVEALAVLRGSLTADERMEIQRHVVETTKFLKQIPWSRGLRQIPKIAGAHHEKLDGSGYPDGLSGDAIVPPARMMAIADIYDALTAADRPYKKAVPVERALDILGMEVRQGRLDEDLFKLFVDAKVYEATRRWRKPR
ncbi:metal dependent phosphohydrolase [Haliangium ochraceum DSM 14365]|uniref:Metal dependent phosphohydrolase n=2 Tax=Haliangium ochraceum TaxID=80816 RepID=D0LI18_HALO1|nr:metal dependent phosphohydrolase [Haliangium ochraceum DSM 14365]